MGRMICFFLIAGMLNSTKAASQLNLRLHVDTVDKKFSLSPLPQNFYNNHIGYVCKKEIQLQKITALPIYIRLGSKDYVDYLEQKPNAIKRN